MRTPPLEAPEALFGMTTVEVPPPWKRRLIEDLHDSDRRAKSLVEPLSVAQLNWRPRQDAWSIGQCIEHLCVSNDLYIAAILRSLEEARPGLAMEITPGWFGRWFIRNYIAPVPVGRRRAPGKIQPRTLIDPSVLDRFLLGNESIRTAVDRAANYDVNRRRFRNPFVPVIYFTVGTGLEILAQHEKRHLRQAEQVRACVDFP